MCICCIKILWIHQLWLLNVMILCEYEHWCGIPFSVTTGERNKSPADASCDLSESESHGNSIATVSQEDSLSVWNNQTELALIDGSLAESDSVSDDPTAYSLQEGNHSIFRLDYRYLILRLVFFYVHLKITGLSQIMEANSGYWLSLVISLLLKCNLLVPLV